MSILRPTYMRQLIDAQNNGLIKIVSGIRRSGKSYLLKTYACDMWMLSNVPCR